MANALSGAPLKYRKNALGDYRAVGNGRSPMSAVNALQALSMIPGVGDIIGPVADAAMYYDQPETRTPGNFALSGLGLLPFVPGLTVFHGTQATRKWYDVPEYMRLMDEGKDIPQAIASSTYPIEKLKGSLGGLKMMDGLGPHVGTAEAAGERLAKNVGISPSKAWNKFRPELDEAYIMPFEMNAQKPFLKADGGIYTETELQSRLSSIAKKLGFGAGDTRQYNKHYTNPKLRQAQKAVKEHLRSQGYDAIPYINSHEARGSTSYVILDDNLLRPYWEGK